MDDSLYSCEHVVSNSRPPSSERTVTGLSRVSIRLVDLDLSLERNLTKAQKLAQKLKRDK